MSTNRFNRLAVFECAGTGFEIGQSLGRKSADLAHRHLLHSPAWMEATDRRRWPFAHAALMRTEKYFPQYLEEIEGLAAGLDLPFDDVFAWNCRGDLGIFASEGCTTVQIPDVRPIVAHNEDGDPGLRSGCMLATLRPLSGCAFTAFMYPASLPGHAFALNAVGLALTVNNIRSRQGSDGLPRMILTRALLNCHSLDEAVELLKSVPRFGAFHVTLSCLNLPDIWSVEFTHRKVSTLVIRQPSAHANHLIHPKMQDEKQSITASSHARQKRSETMLAEMGSGNLDALRILRDRQQSALPIFRLQPDDSDCENTLATAYFEIGAERVLCKVYEPADQLSCLCFSNEALVPYFRADRRP